MTKVLSAALAIAPKQLRSKGLAAGKICNGYGHRV